MVQSYVEYKLENRVQSSIVSLPHEKGVHVVQEITINRPVCELYAFWHNLSNMPHVFKYTVSVQPLAGNRSCWILKLPTGQYIEFEAEMVTDIPNEVISWRSLPGAAIKNAGSVRFIPVGEETTVRLTIEFIPPAGQLGKAILKLFTEVPDRYVAQFLRELKHFMEIGKLTH